MQPGAHDGGRRGVSLDQPDDTPLDPTRRELYRSITWSLKFLSQCTRYDVAYAVNQLARARSKPSKLHMTAAKNYLRYLKGNMSLVLTYRTGCFELTVFCGVSWRNSPDNGKSTSGYFFMMAEGPLRFKTSLLNVTTKSTMKAEAISMALVSNGGGLSLQHGLN